jgi:hypothetical protein
VRHFFSKQQKFFLFFFFFHRYTKLHNTHKSPNQVKIRMNNIETHFFFKLSSFFFSFSSFFVC